MTDKLMHIPYDDTKNYPSVDYNLWLKHFNIQLHDLKNKNSILSQKLLSQRIRKLWDECKKQPNVHSLPAYVFQTIVFFGRSLVYLLSIRLTCDRLFKYCKSTVYEN